MLSISDLVVVVVVVVLFFSQALPRLQFYDENLTPLFANTSVGVLPLH